MEIKKTIIIESSIMFHFLLVPFDLQSLVLVAIFVFHSHQNCAQIWKFPVARFVTRSYRSRMCPVSKNQYVVIVQIHFSNNFEIFHYLKTSNLLIQKVGVLHPRFSKPSFQGSLRKDSSDFKMIIIIMINEKKKFQFVLPQGGPWSLKKISETASNIRVNMNKIFLSWPKISTVIYPKQSIRINTGWTSANLPSDTMITTFPHKSLISNNLISTPQITDNTNINQQVIQMVVNNNNFPVEIQFRVTQKGDQSFILHRLNENLLSQQVLQFDFGNFLTGVVQTAAHLLPLII